MLVLRVGKEHKFKTLEEENKQVWEFENARDCWSQFSHISIVLTTWQLGRELQKLIKAKQNLPYQSLSPRPGEPSTIDGITGNKTRWKNLLPRPVSAIKIKQHELYPET